MGGRRLVFHRRNRFPPETPGAKTIPNVARSGRAGGGSVVPPQTRRSRVSCALVTALLAVVVIASFPSAAAALPSHLVNSSRGTALASNSAAPSLKTLCTLTSNDTYGIYPAPNGGAYVEDMSTGWIVYCHKGHGTIIDTPPLLYSGYFGMAGVKIGSSLDLVLGNGVKHGFYYCKGVTPTGVAGCSPFYYLPTGNPCNSTATPYYCPYEIATDRSLNVYFVAGISSNVAVTTTPIAMKCTAASGYSSCRTLYSFPKGSAPVAITRYKGNLWYANDNCTAADIWENGTLQFVLPPPYAALTSISFSSAGPSKAPTLYVGASGYAWPVGLSCGTPSFNATILSVLPLMPQPTPFTGYNIIPGLDSSLQFTNGASEAYKTV